MTKLLVGNGRTITRDQETPYIKDGAVLIDDGVIAEVGQTQDLRTKHKDAKWLDAKGGVIMPALVNSHAHIYSAFARGLSIKGNNPKTFMEILEGTWWRIDRTLNREDVYWSAMATLVDCIQNGCATVFDHHASYGEIPGSLFEISKAASELGVRACLCYEVSDRDGQELMRAAVKENEDFILWANQNGGTMQKGMMGMHAPFTLSDATLEYCAKHTPEGAGYHIHVAEGIDDVLDSLKKYNKRTVERLFDLNILGPKTIAGHCIHVSPHEISLLKETGTMVVHNPESNMGNAVGIGPVMRMFAEGVLVGLGTDGYTNDMIESYKVGNIIHKHNLADPQAAWTEIPQMLFKNNPEIATRYFGTKIGMLKPGYSGDVTVTDYDPPTPMDGNNLNSHILFGMSGRSVTDLICAGKVLMENRTVTVCDQKEVMAKSRKAASRLWGALNDK